MSKTMAGVVEPAEPCRALDGSVVRELVRPERGGPRNVSVAEAVIEPGQMTRAHYHSSSDEVYYVLSGEGVVHLAENSASVEPGSCVIIPAGHVHRAGCEGHEPLRILCICSPPYTHEQTTPVE
jgi:mannose-6-phosphate isomerase-like protein (cupin superfamily)